MSHPSAAVVEHVTSVDWNIVAAAAAVFCGTVVTTVYGWVTKKKEHKEHLKADNFDVPLAGAVLQDNQTIRESVIVYREVRDQLLIHSNNLSSQRKATEDLIRVLEEVVRELNIIRKTL